MITINKLLLCMVFIYGGFFFDLCKLEITNLMKMIMLWQNAADKIFHFQ